MPTLTVKKVPEALYEKLKERAGRHHRSMNSEVIACLEQILMPVSRDAEVLIAEAEALNRKIGKTLPDLVGEAKREGARMIVVDTDVIAYFWLELASERSQTARRARRKDADWVAPNLWSSEFRNVLRGYMQAGLLTYSEALWFAEKAERDLRGRAYDVQTADVLKLVEQTGHAAYDCEYVALAQSLVVRLVTGDHRVVEAFPDTAILLEDFAG